MNSEAIEFKAKNANDASHITAAVHQTAGFILWAWGAGKGRANTATRMTFDPNDNDLKQFKNAQDKHPAMVKFWSGAPLHPPLPQ